MSNPDFFRVPENEKGLFGVGEKRTELRRLVFASYLLKKEMFMLRGRISGIGEQWLANNTPEFVDYTDHVDGKAIPSRVVHLLQEISYLRSTIKLQARIELRKRHAKR